VPVVTCTIQHLRLHRASQYSMSTLLSKYVSILLESERKRDRDRERVYILCVHVYVHVCVCVCVCVRAARTCERGVSLRTQMLTAQRYSMGDSLLACLMMICSNGPSLHQKEEDRTEDLLFCLSFRVWRMFYSMISSTMSPTQKTCQSRGPLPLCPILSQ
jgi:hypothetical protein